LSLRLHGTIALAFAVPLIVLLTSVRTSVGFWDTGDLQTVAWIAGIPYPTGYPGYVMLAWLWMHAVPIASPAARLNALSAIAIAFGSATICALALLFEVVPLLAVLGGWTFAFAHVVWLRGTYADVHPVGFVTALVAFALAVVWTLRGDARALAGAIVIAGLAVAIDNTTVLVLAGGVVAALGRPWPWRAAVPAASAALLIVVAAYAFLPLRSAYVTSHRLDPTLALGIPAGRPFWDDHHPATVAGFRSLVAGTEWGPHETLIQIISPGAVRAAIERFGGELNDDEPEGMLLAAVVGIGFIAARAPLIGLGLVLAAVLPALFGASYPAEADPERYAFAAYAVAGLGIAVAADRIVHAFGRDRAAPVLGIVAALLTVAVVRDAVRAGDLYAVRADDAAAALGARVTANTRDGAVVIAPWDWATPLAYRAYVEHGFGRRIVVCALPRDYAEHYEAWAALGQVAILSYGAPDIPGYHFRLLSGGMPQVYEILAR
jgi:hypothetical protein